MSTRMIRTLALTVGAGALVLGLAGPAAAAAPTAVASVTMADCQTTRTTAVDLAKTNFKAAKKTAWDAYASSTASKKDAAKARRVALKTALDARKTAFTAARTAYTACVATATDKPADS
jgi:hypothetical protein